MKYIGDYRVSDIIYFSFNTRDTEGVPITLAGTPAVKVYKDDDDTEDDSGITLSVDDDTRTGFHRVKIDLSADGTFYAAGADYQVVITAGTVDGISVVGVCVAEFSIENRSALMPTTATRKLDVSAGGEAGVDWANVGSPTTALNLSGTTVKNVTDGVSVAAGGIQNTSFAAGAIDNAAIAANAIGASEVAADLIDEILDETVGDGTITMRQALRILIAGMAGKLSGAATTEITIRNLDDSADVVVATVDADGNRSAVTVTP